MQLNRVPWEEITICNSSSAFCTWSEMSPQNITTALDTSVRSVIGFVASLWYIASYWIRSILESLSLQNISPFLHVFCFLSMRRTTSMFDGWQSPHYISYTHVWFLRGRLSLCALLHTHHTYNNPHKSSILPQSHLAVNSFCFSLL